VQEFQRFAREKGYFLPGEKFRRTQANVAKVEAAKADEEFQSLKRAAAAAERRAEGVERAAEIRAEAVPEARRKLEAGERLTREDVSHLPIADLPSDVRTAMQNAATAIIDDTKSPQVRAALQKIIDGKNDTGAVVEKQKARITRILLEGQDFDKPGGLMQPMSQVAPEVAAKLSADGGPVDIPAARAPRGQAMAAPPGKGGFITIGQPTTEVTPGPKPTPAPRRAKAVNTAFNETIPAPPLNVASSLQRTGQEIAKAVAPAVAGEEFRTAAQLLRRQLGVMAQKAEAASEALRLARRQFLLAGQQAMLDFIDAIETGQIDTIEDPQLRSVARTMRDLLDGRRDAIQKLGKGKLQSYYQNYFPHIWKDPKKAQSVIGRILGRRPFEGSKAFLKKRTIMTVKEGVEAGLQLVTNNPVDLVLLKLHEMDRYIMAQDIIQEATDRGMLKFVYARTQAPEGFTQVKDGAFTVFMPPEITVEEAYDRLLVDNLMSIAQALGVSHQRMGQLRNNTWGRAQGDQKIETRFAGPESVLAHEIGHVLGARYNLYDWMLRKGDGEWRKIAKGAKKGEQKFVPSPDAVAHRRTVNAEWRALADARLEGADAGPGFTDYVRRRQEKEAVLLEAFVHAPQKMQELAPTLTKLFKQFLNDHAELRPLLDIAPSLTLGTGEVKLPLPGVTELGKYYATDPLALLLNNYVSPGLRNSRNQIIATSYNLLRRVGNAMNQASLSLSAFHGLNVTTDVMASHIGLGLRKLLATKNQKVSGLKDIAAAPVSPLVNLWRGRRLQKAYRTEVEKIADPHLRKMVEAVIVAGGRARMDPFYHNNAVSALIETMREIASDVQNIQSVGDVANIPVKVARGVRQGFGATLEVLAKPLMEWFVPVQKLGMFYQLATHEMERANRSNLSDEQLQTRLASAWDSVDNRMGQLVYDNLFWNKTFKDASMMAVRSVGWNLGSWREFGGALIDPFTTPARMRRGDAWLSHKMGYTIGAVTVYSILGATLMYLMTGRGPEEPKDYFFPKTGRKNPDGSDERLSLPTYAKDWVAYGTRPGTTVRHKLHPIWSTLSEMTQNEDYFGTEIRHKDDPIVKQASALAEHMAKSFIPFSIRNYGRFRAAGSTKWNAGLSSLTGISSAPKYITQTPAQKLMSEITLARLPRGTRTNAQFEQSMRRKKTIRMIRAGDIDVANPPKAVRDQFTDGQWASLLREAAVPPFTASFKRMSIRDAIKVYNVSSPAEQKEVTAIIIDKARRAKVWGETPDEIRDAQQMWLELVEPNVTPELRTAFNAAKRGLDL
jgi:hypothetical protein